MILNNEGMGNGLFISTDLPFMHRWNKSKFTFHTSSEPANFVVFDSNKLDL